MTDQRPLDPSVQASLLDQQVRERAALARTAGEWFDIYHSIVEHGVKTTMEANGEGHLVMERLQPRRSDATAVRRELMAHGMELSEEIEIEGPVVQHDERGIPTMVAFPRGQWMKLHWPDGSQLEFRGSKAFVALGFIMWWETFHQQYKTLTAKDPAPTQRRIIEPRSAEWWAYMNAKKKDQAKGTEL